MLWKHLLLAAGAVGLASAQASSATSQTSGQAPTTTGAAGAKSSGKKGKGGEQVPADLSGGFKTDQIVIKVSFKHHHKGKKDHTKTGTETATSMKPMSTGKKHDHEHHGLTMKDTMEAPHFHLVKSEGATEQTKWVIVMVDTTSQSNRVLHYVHSDYMMKPGNHSHRMDPSAKGQAAATPSAGAPPKMMMPWMELNSTTTPQMPWKAPGMLGDTGAKRQYTFLMYSQPSTFNVQNMPSAGSSVDMSQFAQQNGLQPAIAGHAIAVDTASNGTSSSSPSASGTGASGPGSTQIKAATGAASAIRGQAYTAGAIGALLACGMALL